jgi:peptide/nickel transport system substrate-binding protein
LPRGGQAIYGFIGAEPPHLDPQLSRSGRVLISSDSLNDWLVRYDLSNTLVPSLAREWQQVDERTLRFVLRPNAKFHNGRVITAEDVKQSIEHVKNPETKSVYAREMDVITEVQTPSPDTVVLRLAAPQPVLIHNLSRINIVPIEVIKAQGDMRTNPVGAGPFKLKEWKRGSSIAVERFAEYWDPEAPRLDGITFRFIPDERSMLASFEAGEVHAFRGFGAPSYHQLKGRQNQGIFIDAVPTLDWGYLAMNQERKPFEDVRVRRAVMLALDRAKFNEVAHLGLSKLSWFPVPNDSPYYPKDLEYKRDVDGAKKLLAEAGYPNGFDSTVLVASFPLEEPYGVILQQQLKEIGINLKVEVQETSAFVPRVLTQRDYDITMLSDAGSADPSTFMDQYYKSDGANNLSNYKSAKMDDILTRAAATYAEQERVRLYRQAFELAVEDAVLPVILMYSLTIAWRDPLLGQYILSTPENFRNNWPAVAMKPRP